MLAKFLLPFAGWAAPGRDAALACWIGIAVAAPMTSMALQESPPAAQEGAFNQDELQREIAEFFENLTRAVARPGSRAVLTSISSQHLLDEATRRGWAAFESDGDRAAAMRPLRRALREWFDAFSTDLEWDQFASRSICFPAEDRAEVVTQHRTHDWSGSSRWRWWLVRLGPQLWKVYDLEDLEVGLRLSTMIGVVSGAFQTTEPWHDDLVSTIKAYHESGSIYGVAYELNSPPDPLDRLLAAEVPEELRPFILLLRATLASLNEEPGDALHFAEQIDQIPGAKAMAQRLKARALMEMEDYDEAIACFKEFGRLLGYDAYVYEMMSDCYFQLGERSLAVQMAEKGLAENPMAVGCLASLAVALPASRQGELIAHFEKLQHREGAYETVLDWALRHDEMETGGFVFEQFKKVHPESSLIPYYNEFFVR